MLFLGGQKWRSTREAFCLPSPLSPNMLNTLLHKKSRSVQGQTFLPAKGLCWAGAKSTALLNSAFIIFSFCYSVCVFKKKVVCEHRILINWRQSWLQKAIEEEFSGISCRTQQGQGTCPSCRLGNMSHRGSDHACAPGPVKIQGKSVAVDEVQNISVLVASALISPRQCACNF